MPQVAAEMLIFDFGKTKATADMAKKTYESTLATLDETINTVIGNITNNTGAQLTFEGDSTITGNFTNNGNFEIYDCYNSAIINNKFGAFAGDNDAVSNCYALSGTVVIHSGVTFVNADDLRLLSSKLNSSIENNATVNRPILKSAKEVPTAYIHELEYVPEIPSTCSEFGRKAYYICHCGCGEEYFDNTSSFKVLSISNFLP